MKYFFCIVVLFLVVSCDYQGTYTFEVKNETSNQIELRFENSNHYGSTTEANKDTVLLDLGQEKTIRIIYAPLNSPAHDCLNQCGMTYFLELIFETYVDGEKLEKQLWQPKNWTYSKSSKWAATYSMTISNEMVNLNID